METRARVWIAAAATTVVAFVGYAGHQQRLAGAPGLTTSGPEPPNAIVISIASSITKREWLEDAIREFNASSPGDEGLQVGRKPIVVRILKEEDPLAPGAFKHYRSPMMAKDTLTGKITPTILSPADDAWIA